jgi:hypothetical protein
MEAPTLCEAETRVVAAAAAVDAPDAIIDAPLVMVPAIALVANPLDAAAAVPVD